METQIGAEQIQQFLTFHIGGEEYAIGITRVREIIEYDTVTRVPKTLPFIRGVINLRGSVVPVIDLAVKFGLPETAVTRSTCIVILELSLNGEETTMGIMADSVSQVVDLLPGDIEKVPSFGTRVNTDYLLGMAKLSKKFALILDVDRVLSLEELEQVAAVEDTEHTEQPAQSAIEA